MLVGKSENGKQLNLLLYTKEEIEHFRKETWYCCACNQKLVMKNGQVKTPHFAHLSKKECAAFSEGETEEHLLGKQLLADWCDNSQISYELEAYLPELKQRPDLLIEKKVAIEFQCSSLKIDRLVERTEVYLKHGYEVIWITGKRFFLTKCLSQMQRALVSFHHNVGFFFWELDVYKKSLRCHYHIEELSFTGSLFFTSRHWQFPFGNIKRMLAYPTQANVFVNRVYPVDKIIPQLMTKLEGNLFRQVPKYMTLQGHFYKVGKHLLGIDWIFFLPVTQSLLIKEDSIYYRWLVWSCLSRKQELSLSELYQMFREQLYVSGSKLNKLPLVETESVIVDFFLEYMSLLEVLGYLSLSNNKMSVIKSPETYHNQEERQADYLNRLKDFKYISSTPRKNVIL